MVEHLLWGIWYMEPGRKGHFIYGCIHRVCQGADCKFFIFFLVENDNYLIFLCILLADQIFCLGNIRGYPPESPAAVYSRGSHPVKCDKNATP